MIRFYAALFHTGSFGANVAANFRFRRNGVLIPPSRGTTQNQITARIMCLSFERRITGVAAGLQTIDCEWTRFGGGGLTVLAISAAALPDLFGAGMTVENCQ